MELIECHTTDQLCELLFVKELNNSRREIKVKFSVNWKFTELWSIGKIRTQTEAYHVFQMVDVHIPSEEERELFKECINYYAKEMHTPVLVKVTRHPGYPLCTVYFNSEIISDKEVSTLISNIMNGIATAEKTEYDRAETVESSADHEEEQEEVIIEFEEDEETKLLMHQPAKTRISPLEKSENND